MWAILYSINTRTLFFFVSHPLNYPTVKKIFENRVIFRLLLISNAFILYYKKKSIFQPQFHSVSSFSVNCNLWVFILNVFFPLFCRITNLHCDNVLHTKRYFMQFPYVSLCVHSGSLRFASSHGRMEFSICVLFFRFSFTTFAYIFRNFFSLSLGSYFIIHRRVAINVYNG